MAEFATDVAEFVASSARNQNSDQILAQLRRILESPHFVHAHQLQHFLEHLVTFALAGREDELKEYSLGKDVFRRGDAYDPRTDAIVRVQASLLRKRLCAYYESDGKDETLRVELPKGSYVPHFTEAAPLDRTAVPVPQATEVPPPSRRGFLNAAAAFACGAVTMGAAWAWHKQTEAPHSLVSRERGGTFSAREASPRIWGSLLQSDRPIQLAFGCPQFFRGGGLYIRDVNVNDSETAEANARLRFLTRKFGQYLTPAANTYTGVGEILGIYRMTQFVTHQGVDSQLENVQLLTPQLIQNKNLILVSSFRFRTLLDLLSLPHAFAPSFDGSGAFINAEPHGDEPSAYRPAGSGGVARSYGLVSYWTKPETGGRVMLLSGIESWATQGTVMYITNEQSLRDLEQRLEPDFNDSESKGVQVLVEIQGRDDRALSIRYVTHRVL